MKYVVATSKVSKSMLVLLPAAAVAHQCSSALHHFDENDADHVRALQKATELVFEMTFTELTGLLHGVEGAWEGQTTGIRRLGVPPLTMNDEGSCLRSTVQGTTTAYPEPLHIAASFNPQNAYVLASNVAREAKGKGLNVLLAPGLNVARVPSNGRNFQYFSGEDPILGQQMAKSYVQGAHDQKVIANTKHYILNNQETHRGEMNSVADERVIREIYQRPFHVGQLSVMCSYNRVNGMYACENEQILAMLAKDLGMHGFIVSDFGATHSTVLSANAGLDIEMPGQDFFNNKSLAAAVENGELKLQTLQDKAIRVVYPMAKLGLLGSDWPNPEMMKANVTSAEHRAVARDLAIKGYVLLKNDNDLLPLPLPGGSSTLHGGDSSQQQSEKETITLIGDHCHDRVARGFGSAQEDPIRWYSFYDGFQEVAGDSYNIVYLPTQDAGYPSVTAAARDSAYVFFCVGGFSGEGWDRDSLKLEDAGLINNYVVFFNSKAKMIVLVNSPAAAILDWAAEDINFGNVRGILCGFLPGEMFGPAAADIIFGKAAPTGRLPLTMPMTENDQKFTESQFPGVREGADGLLTANYTEGLEVGYRYYTANKVKPRFPFGWGLTYTSFEFSDLNTNGGSSDGSLSWSVTVSNIGRKSGVETVQGYLTYPEHVGEPPMQLKSFGQTDSIGAGSSATFTGTLPSEEMKVWSNAKAGWVMPKGKFIFCVAKHVDDAGRLCIDFESTITGGDECVWYAADDVSTSSGFTSESQDVHLIDTIVIA